MYQRLFLLSQDEAVEKPVLAQVQGRVSTSSYETGGT